eukprot:COSAG01_NODE_11184_length_1988_cov_2.370566_1_plen_25_part_10
MELNLENENTNVKIHVQDAFVDSSI